MDTTEQAILELQALNRRMMMAPESNLRAYIEELRKSAGLVKGWKEFLEHLHKEAGYQ